MSFFVKIFAWWRDYTIGTGLFTWRKGELVGKDAQGNRYYRERGGKRRWVLYNGEVDASRISSDWHGWLHHTFDRPPTEAPFAVKPWEAEHLSNPTGSPAAYYPPGSLNEGGKRPPTTGDYEAWRPR